MVTTIEQFRSDRAGVSDADLVTAARQRSAAADDAFGELVRRYQRMVYAVVLSLVQPADVDDVVQNAFLRAFRNLDLLADPGRFGVWLRRIAFGVSIDHVRAERARSATHVELDDETGGPAAIASTDPSPLDQVEHRETASRVLAALDRMPARYRVPLSLYHIDGLSHAKVAHTLGVPESTVRSLVSRARKKLTRVLANSPEVRNMTDATHPLSDSLDVLDEQGTGTPRLLHVLNGDSVRGTLERSDVPGAFLPYADILHEGPVPLHTGTPQWRETRARYMAANGYVPYAEAMRFSDAWDAGLAGFDQYDEVVLWFEHDLFDQLLLIRHLYWFSRQDLGKTTLSLICIGEYPGYEPFHGLGQLNADELASLLGTRSRVSTEQLALGERAWRAFTSSDPTEFDALTHGGTSDALPFLAGALRRFLEEYPWTDTGLPRTERHILEILAERGPLSPYELFVAEQQREERAFMGDSTFWNRLRQLAVGDTPLVSLDVPSWDEPDLRTGVIAVTHAGRDVLAGGADAIRLRGFDRWLGGTHLQAALGGDVTWRYDCGGPPRQHLTLRLTPRIRPTPGPR